MPLAFNLHFENLLLSTRIFLSFLFTGLLAVYPRYDTSPCGQGLVCFDTLSPVPGTTTGCWMFNVW